MTSLILGSLYTSRPGGLSKIKLNKIGSQIPFTKLPSTTLHFKWNLSFPVILLGFSLLHVPEVYWMNPSISPKGLELDWINPKTAQKEDFFSEN